MGNRKKAKLEDERGKFKCPSCGKTDFDHMENFGMIERDGKAIMFDGLACRNCEWAGAVRADKIRAVNNGS